MAATSNRAITTVYSGDVVGTETQSAAQNAASPAAITLHNLASGSNTITVPPFGSAGGISLAGVTIIPPLGNSAGITLKGVSGDTGIVLHKTDPTSLGLDSGVTAFVLGATAGITGLRCFWT